MVRPIYLDNHATTPVDPRVAAIVLRFFLEDFGNAGSADHIIGDHADAALSVARNHVAALLGSLPDDVIFTSGATESISLALQGFVAARLRRTKRPPRIALTAVEHSAVLETVKALTAAGRASSVVLPVDRSARLDLDELARVVRSGVDLLCVMGANNEVGTVYPLVEIGRIAEASGTLFLCDATQAAGKVQLSIDSSAISFTAISAHKMYGPMGVGALIVRDRRDLEPVSWGGQQQHGLRPGTLNVPGIVGLGEACRLRRLEMVADEAAIALFRDQLQYALSSEIDGLIINGAHGERLAGNLHVSIPDVPNGAIIARVRERLAIATGAACASGIEAPSHVLRAMRLPTSIQDGALRIGVGKFNTQAEISEASELLVRAVGDARKAMVA